MTVKAGGNAPTHAKHSREFFALQARGKKHRRHLAGCRGGILPWHAGRGRYAPTAGNEAAS